MNKEEQPKFKPVYIFGAGASVAMGMPVLCSFLQKAKEVRYSGIHDEDSWRQFDLVFAYQRDLYQSQKIAGTDLDDLEVLFSILDMEYQTSGRSKTLYGVREALLTLIIVTLKQSEKKDFNNYSQALRFLAKPNGSCFITFNYDLCIEKALTLSLAGQREEPRSEFNVDYGLPVALYSPFGNPVPSRLLLKLHGSVNWMWCNHKRCGKLEAKQEYLRPSALSVDSMGHELNCPERDKPLNLILPPTWNKTNYSEHITTLWQKAINELSLATHLFIIGYSFPRTDVFFEQMFTLAMRDSRNLRYIYIVNSDSKMKDVLLPSLFNRYYLARSVRFLSAKFEDLIELLTRPHIFSGPLRPESLERIMDAIQNKHD